MSEQDFEVNYSNLSLLLAGVVNFLIDHDNAGISESYFNQDYSNKRLSVIYDTATKNFVFGLEEDGEYYYES